MYTLRSHYIRVVNRSILARGLAEKTRLDKAIEEDVSNLPVSMRNKDKMRERYGLGKDPRLPSLNQVYAWIRERKEFIKNNPDRKFSRQVFKRNPLYMYPRQILEQTRREMYQLHKEQPETYTAEALANKFQLSLEKVKAILELKKIAEEKEKAGIQLNYELAETMDKMFAENEKLYGGHEETRRQSYAMSYAMAKDPALYQTIERNKKLAEERVKERRQALEKQDELGKIISKEPELSNRRHSFIIFDKSLKKVFVREKDGTLRNGTWEEREKMFRKFAPKELH